MYRVYGRSFTRQPDKFVEVLRSLPGCPPVLTSMGNHETDGEGKRAWLDALYPGAARNLTGNGNDRVLYYSFNYKNAHFVCLDSNRTVAGKMVWATLPEEELGWLDEDLRAHRNMPSFVFLHEPIKPHPDKPAHLLQNRGRLIHVLKSHPRAKWIFNGHDHYASHGRAWDLDISHVDRTATNVDGTAGLVVRVDGERVTVNKFDTTGTLTSVTNDYDLDGLFASRLQREGARAVYRIAEASLDMARGDPLRDAVSLIGPAAAVQPTQGLSMIQVDRAPPKFQGEPPRDLYAWISTDVVGIRKGMKFAYDVRIDPDSVSDRLALILDLDLPAGVKAAELRDQNGISLGFIDAAGGGLQLPSLGERARGKWYRREFDLSHLTGGWIVSLRLFAGLPKSDGPAEGRLKFYLDNIHFTWSDR